MIKLFVSIFALMLFLSPFDAAAAPLRVFVADMNAIGVSNRDEMKQMLQALLAARLNNDSIMSVGGASEADLLVSGTYIAIGKVYSFDAIARTVAGRTVTRAHIQGDVKDELMTTVGKLADKLSSELVKSSAAAVVPVPVPVTRAVLPQTAPKSDFIQREQVVRNVPAGDFVKPKEYEYGSTTGWLSKRLDGAFNLMALGSAVADGSRNLFLAEERKLTYFRQGSDMKTVAEADFAVNAKIVSLDVKPEPDGDKIFVTIVKEGDPVSQIWTVKNDKLVKIADGLPWLFRTAALAGGPVKLYAQSVGIGTNDYYGPVYEAAVSGKTVTTKNPLEMPRYGNIYSFNQFKDKSGNLFTIVINPDNYLIVYDNRQKEVWRSNDRFGGSELYYQKEDLANIFENGGKFRWIFMNQRIQVSSKGDVLVGKNDGFWVLGTARTYKKGAVYNLQWNGSSLEEQWHTKDTQNYMPDYFYDEAKNELLILQTVQRPSASSRGASSLAIKKVE